MELETEATGLTQGGFNEIRGYGKFQASIPETLKNGFTPDIPSIDPMVKWQMEQRPSLNPEPYNCDGFKITEKDYRVAMTQANQKGYKKTKEGVHGTKTEMFNTGMYDPKKAPEKTDKDAKPTLEEMNKEYNRYKYGYMMYPANNGKQLDGAKPVLLTGNEIIYQPSIAMGGDIGGRRFGHQGEKYSLPVALN